MRLYSFYTNQPVRRQANLVAHTLTTNSIYFDNENIFNVNSYCIRNSLLIT